MDRNPGPTLPKVVIDSVRDAWDYSDQPAVYDLDKDFVRTYRDSLDKAARDLMRPLLAAGWQARGLVVEFEEDGRSQVDLGNEVEPADETYWAVWKAAADRITSEALLTRAGFDPDNYLRPEHARSIAGRPRRA